MEFVSGGSLSKILRAFGPLPEPLVRKYTRQITEGLAHVHGHNYAHRDIKGACVCVCPWVAVVLPLEPSCPCALTLSCLRCFA